MYRRYASKSKLIDHLRKSNIITSREVEEAMTVVDRKNYCPMEPYADNPICLGYNSTISAPHMHAYCLEEIKDQLMRANARALDVGCGSGYLTACMAYLMRESSGGGGGGAAYGIDYIPELIEMSISNTSKGNPDLLDTHVFFQVGDGHQGLAEKQPFNCIHVGAAAEEVPQPLIDQLAPDGKLVIPLTDRRTFEQWLTVVKKGPDGTLSYRKLLPVQYVPLVLGGQKE